MKHIAHKERQIFVSKRRLVHVHSRRPQLLSKLLGDFDRPHSEDVSSVLSQKAVNGRRVCVVCLHSCVSDDLHLALALNPLSCVNSMPHFSPPLTIASRAWITWRAEQSTWRFCGDVSSRARCWSLHVTHLHKPRNKETSIPFSRVKPQDLKPLLLVKATV